MRFRPGRGRERGHPRRQTPADDLAAAPDSATRRVTPSGLDGDFTEEIAPADIVEYRADFTEEPVGRAPEVHTTPFDPEPGRERIRGRLAQILVVAVIAEITAAMAGAIAGASVQDIKDVLEPTLGPLIALAASAVGFYYAGHSPR